MTTMAQTMTAIADVVKAAGIDRVYDWPSESVNAPCAVVTYPDMDFNFTYGVDHHVSTYPVWMLVGRAGTKAARTAVTPFIDSLVPALDAMANASVTRGRLANTTIAGITYLGLVLYVEVIEA